MLLLGTVSHIFYVARFGSKPTELGYTCLLHALRAMYRGRHVGLTLGGHSNHMVASVSLIMPTGTGADVTDDPSPPQQGPTYQLPPGDRNIATAHCDAGHAEAGPSTGGHSPSTRNNRDGACSLEHTLAHPCHSMS